MSANKNNISQILNYLEGKLDARAMHRLEREAQDDPFLMDALEGYEQAGKVKETDLEELKNRLAYRVAKKPARIIILWRVLPIAAAVLLMLGAGYLFLKPSATKQYVAAVVQGADKNIVKTSPLSVDKTTIAPPKPKYAITKKPVTAPPRSAELLAEEAPPVNNKIAYQEDTVTYKVSAYPVRKKTTFGELLKKMEGMEVDSNGNLLAQGKPITKVKINGKDFVGGDVNQAVKNLPADILTKIQVVDDYGDLANAGIKDSSPLKVLNVETDTIHKSQLIAANRPDLLKLPVGNGLDKAIPQSLNEVVVVEKKPGVGCRENIPFKTKFFANIALIETYALAQANGSKQSIGTKAFLKALAFINSYTNTGSLAKVAGYRVGYANLDDFKTDKNSWINWYNANRCNNLK